jgi:hypothetical protein
MPQRFVPLAKGEKEERGEMRIPPRSFCLCAVY